MGWKPADRQLIWNKITSLSPSVYEWLSVFAAHNCHTAMQNLSWVSYPSYQLSARLLSLAYAFQGILSGAFLVNLHPLCRCIYDKQYVHYVSSLVNICGYLQLADIVLCCNSVLYCILMPVFSQPMLGRFIFDWDQCLRLQSQSTV